MNFFVSWDGVFCLTGWGFPSHRTEIPEPRYKSLPCFRPKKGPRKPVK